MTCRRSTYHHGDLPRALRAAARRLVAEHATVHVASGLANSAM
jgi:hypothetical protein